jgi:hypothetical protein
MGASNPVQYAMSLVLATKRQRTKSFGPSSLKNRRQSESVIKENKEGEPGTVEYEEPHGSPEGFSEKPVLEARQVGMETRTFVEGHQFSERYIVQSSYQVNPP